MTTAEGIAAPADAGSLECAIACLAVVNKAKADAEVSMGREVELLELAAAPATLGALARVAADVWAAARVARAELVPDAALAPGAFVVRAARFAARAAGSDS